jgi:hypothetical protein
MGGFFSSSARAPSLGSPAVNLEAGRTNRRNNAYNAKAPRVNGGPNVEAPPAGPNGATAPATNAGNNLEGRGNNSAAAPKRPNNTNRKNNNLENGNNTSRRANNVIPNNASTVASDPGSRPISPSNNMAGGKRKSRRSSRKHRKHSKKH